jgi:putative methionine-R-sulfoxide reductase with GAF domain
MNLSAISRLFQVSYPYPSVFERRRAYVLVVASVFATVFAAARLILALIGVIGSPDDLPAVALTSVIPIVGFVITYALVQRGLLTAGSWWFVLLLTVITGALSIFRLTTPTVMFIPLIAAGVVLNRQALLTVLVLVAVASIATFFAQSSLPRTLFVRPAETAQADLLETLTLLGLGYLLLIAFSGATELYARRAVQDVDRQRAIGAAAVQLQRASDESTLLQSTLRLLQTDLHYAHARLYLIDNKGEVSRLLRPGMTEAQVISAAALNAGDSAIIDDVRQKHQTLRVSASDPAPRNIHVMVPARQAIVLPVLSGDLLLAVLTVQTDRAGEVSANEVAALEQYADTFAQALLSTRRIADLQRALREQEQVSSRVRQQLAEVQGRGAQSQLGGWSSFTRARGGTFGYDMANGSFTPAADLPDSFRQAFAQGDIVLEMREDHQELSAPIILRGEVLGAMTFRLPLEAQVTDLQRNLVRTVSNNLGIALENNRLFEQSQALASRERKANEVGTDLLTADSIDALLQQAAQSFTDALGAVFTRVVVQKSAVDSDRAPAARRGAAASSVPANGAAYAAAEGQQSS